MKTKALAFFLITLSINLFAATPSSTYSNLFYADMGKKAGDDVVTLTDAPADKRCPSGYKHAWRGFLSLGEFKLSKNLCWMASEKSPDVTIYDPEATFFKTSKISQDKFVKIKTEQEHAAEANRASIFNSQNNPQSRNQFDAPLILNINGNPTPCIRIGVILECD